MSFQETTVIREFIRHYPRQTISLGVGDYLGEVWVTYREVDDDWSRWILYQYVDGRLEDMGNHYWWGRWPDRWHYH